eukprot:m.21200 g.21200  ORF g.21200 m.21200 type:complete len:78 (+) comp28150_c0_seq1:3123-3356(+)
MAERSTTTVCAHFFYTEASAAALSNRNVVTSMKNFLLVSLSLSNTNYCVSANKRIHPVPEQVHIYFREYSVGTFCCI